MAPSSAIVSGRSCLGCWGGAVSLTPASGVWRTELTMAALGTDIGTFSLADPGRVQSHGTHKGIHMQVMTRGAAVTSHHTLGAWNHRNVPTHCSELSVTGLRRGVAEPRPSGGAREESWLPLPALGAAAVLGWWPRGSCHLLPCTRPPIPPSPMEPIHRVAFRALGSP